MQSLESSNNNRNNFRPPEAEFRRPLALIPMPINYYFRDSKMTDSVAKALIFVSKFSKKQALVKFSDSSVSIIWGGSSKFYYIHTEATSLDMFKEKRSLRSINGIDHCTVIQVNPSILGRTLKVGTSERSVSLGIIRPNKVKVSVEQSDNKRKIVHTIPCEMKTIDDYKSMLIGEVESSVCRYDTRCYVDNIQRFKHIVNSCSNLGAQRISIWSRESDEGNDLTIRCIAEASEIIISLSDLENGFADFDSEKSHERRQDAGVNIDTKKLSLFLSNLAATRKSKISFDIEHNKCLKITLDNESGQGEKFHQSILLLHSLNN